MVRPHYGESLLVANSIADMLVMETAEPDKTLTPIDVFGEKSKDADDVFEKLSSIHGSIQSNPAYDEEGNLKYKGGYPGQGSFLDPFDLIPGLGAVGASIRGGKVAKTTLEQLLGLSKKLGLKPPKGITAGDLRGKGLENILNRNASSADNIKYAKAREAYDNVLNKHKIADPDKQEFVDSITALLTRSKN